MANRTNIKQDLGKVLLVDDDSTNNFLSACVLRQTDATGHIFEAEDRREALELVVKEDFSLILLDMNMPGMNGFEFIGALQQLQESAGFTVPVVVLLTTTESYLGSDRATQYPMVKGFLTKPLTGEHVDYLLSLAIDEEEPKVAA